MIIRHESMGPGRDPTPNPCIFSQTRICSQTCICCQTHVSLIADPGVVSSIPAQSHTFVEIDHEIITTVILFPSTESLKKGCCQLE